ncbi:uncharacterized protein [Notamacropus eugenii]|uniref:uncharacterized protein isoform X2 n=1 Tax=Notamacropus eugenii TaxID=9315 RepID=UPI003B680833
MADWRALGGQPSKPRHPCAVTSLSVFLPPAAPSSRACWESGGAPQSPSLEPAGRFCSSVVGADPGAESSARRRNPGPAPNPPQSRADVGVALQGARWCADAARLRVFKRGRDPGPGLPVAREDLISYFEEGEAPWILEPKGPRDFCSAAVTRFGVKKTTTNSSFSMEESGQLQSMSDGPCDFNLKDIRDSDIRVDKNPKNPCEFNKLEISFPQHLV